jgi:hypothetical protein
MRVRFGDVECEVEVVEITKKGDDARTWRYSGKNLTTGKEFDYTVQITKTALQCKGLATQIQDAIDTKGESLIRKWLSENRGYWMRGIVSERKIDEVEKKDNYSKLL